MATSNFFRWLATINSDDPQLKRKGHLLQIIVLFSIAINLSQIVVYLNTPLLDDGQRQIAYVRMGLNLLLALVALFIIRRGYPVLAAHLFFVVFNAAIFRLILENPSQATIFVVMLLAPVIGISLLSRVKASIPYFFVPLGLALFYLPAVQQPYLLPTWVILVATAITWFFAINLQSSATHAAQLTQELQQTTTDLQRRIQQMQIVTEVGRVVGSYLNPTELMHHTAEFIRTQFGFYHAAIYLLDETGRYVVVRKATGKVGEIMMARPHRLLIGSSGLVSWVAANRQARLVNDVYQEPAGTYTPNPLLPETRAELGLPLIARGELVGVINVHSKEANAFQSEDIAILQLMANLIAGGIDNARLFAQTETRLSETEALFKIISALSTTLDIGEINRRAVRIFSEQMNLARCSMNDLDVNANLLHTTSEFVHLVHGEIVDEYNLDIEGSFDLNVYTGSQQVIRSGRHQVRFAEDPNLDESERAILLAFGHSTCLEVPLIVGEERVGTVELFRDYDQPLFNDVEIELATAMATQVAIALKNAHLATDAQSRAAQLSSLNRVSQALSMAPDLQTVYTNARREILSLTEATGISILLLTPDKEFLTWVYGYEYGAEVNVSGVQISINQGFSGQVVRSRHWLLINDRFEDARKMYQSAIIGRQAQAWLGVPLIVANELIGVLVIENGDDPKAFDEADVQLLTTISGSIATTINNLRQFDILRISQARAEKLYHIGQRINTAQGIGQALQALMENEVLQGSGRVTLNLFNETWYWLPPTGVEIAAAWPNEPTEAMKQLLAAIPSEFLTATLDRTRPVFIQDVSGRAEINHQLFATLAGSPDYQAYTTFPLIASDAWVGYLAIFNQESRSLTQDEIREISSLVAQAAATIQNQQLLQQTQEALVIQSQQRLQLQIAAEVSSAASSIRNVNELMQRAVESIQEGFGLYQVSLFLVDPHSNEVVMRAGTGQVGRQLMGRGLKIGIGSQSLVGGATADGQLRLVQDVKQALEWVAEPLLPNTRSELVLPLKVHRQVIGVLDVQSASVNDFTPALIGSLQTMSEQLAIAIENAQLLAQSEARVQRQKMLNEVSANIHRSSDVNTIVKMGLQALSEQLAGVPVRLQLSRKSSNR